MRYLWLVLLTVTILFVPEYPVYAQQPPPPAGQPSVSSTVRNFEQHEVKEFDRLASGAGKLRKDFSSEAAHLERDFGKDLKRDEKKFASEEARLRQKIAGWQNQDKAARVAKINQELQQLNQQATSRMNQQLTYMSNRLTLLQNTEATSSSGISNLQDINDAKQAIVLAQAAVSTQAAKTYSINVTTEPNAKVDAKTARDNLFKDLKATQATIMTAKQAVVKAYGSNNQQI